MVVLRRQETDGRSRKAIKQLDNTYQNRRAQIRREHTRTAQHGTAHNITEQNNTQQSRIKTKGAEHIRTEQNSSEPKQTVDIRPEENRT